MTSLNVTDIVSFSLVAAKTPPEENEIKQKQLFSKTTFTIDISSQELRCKAQIHAELHKCVIFCGGNCLDDDTLR